MAADGEADMMKAHERTYTAFIGLIKNSIVFLVIIVAIVLFLIAR